MFEKDFFGYTSNKDIFFGRHSLSLLFRKINHPNNLVRLVDGLYLQHDIIA